MMQDAGTRATTKHTPHECTISTFNLFSFWRCYRGSSCPLTTYTSFSIQCMQVYKIFHYVCGSWRLCHWDIGDYAKNSFLFGVRCCCISFPPQWIIGEFFNPLPKHRALRWISTNAADTGQTAFSWRNATTKSLAPTPHSPIGMEASPVATHSQAVAP